MPSRGVQLRAIPLALCRCGTRTTLKAKGRIYQTVDSAGMLVYSGPPDSGRGFPDGTRPRHQVRLLQVWNQVLRSEEARPHWSEVRLGPAGRAGGQAAPDRAPGAGGGQGGRGGGGNAGRRGSRGGRRKGRGRGGRRRVK